MFINSTGGVYALMGSDEFLLFGNNHNAEFVSCGNNTVITEGNNNSSDFSGGAGNFALVIGNNNSMAFGCRGGYSETGNGAWIIGTNNSVSISSGFVPMEPTSDFVVDAGQGTHISVLSSYANVSVYDFQYDPTGKVNLEALGVGPAQALANEHSDGHGGTMINIASMHSTVDFIGDTHVGATSFV